MKLALVYAPILVLLEFCKHFVVESDVSYISIWVALLQDNRPIAYFNCQNADWSSKSIIYVCSSGSCQKMEAIFVGILLLNQDWL